MYAEIAEKVLKDKNPQEYLRLKVQQKLQPFLENLEEQYGQEELSVVMQVIRESQNQNLSFQKREQAIEGAKLQIQEVLIAQLVEQLSVPAEASTIG